MEVPSKPFSANRRRATSMSYSRRSLALIRVRLLALLAMGTIMPRRTGPQEGAGGPAQGGRALDDPGGPQEGAGGPAWFPWMDGP